MAKVENWVIFRFVGLPPHCWEWPRSRKSNDFRFVCSPPHSWVGLKQVIKTQIETTQPLRFYFNNNNLIEFTKIIFNLIKTQFETTQPLRFYFNNNNLIEFTKFIFNLFKTQIDATQPLRFVFAQ